MTNKSALQAALESVEMSPEAQEAVASLQAHDLEQIDQAILAALGKTPAEIVRKKEAAEAGIDPAALDDAALIAAMVANPAVIERPIVVNGAKAALGRPPESVLAIL